MDHAAAGDFEISCEDDFYGFGVDAVFFFQNSLGESCVGVVVSYFDDGLQDDGAGVEIFVHEMDGAAGEFYAVFEGLALGFEAGEGREKRRMDVEDAIGEGGDEIGREQAHVAGEADEIDLGFLQSGDDLAVVGFALEAFGGDNAGGEAALLGAVDSGGAIAIAEDEGDFGVGYAGGGDAVG